MRTEFTAVFRSLMATGLYWLMLSCASAQVHEADETPFAPAKVTICARCHGADGNSSDPLRPRLAGQDMEYLVRQLRAFRAGTRRNATMNGVASGLSETDITRLAAYFAAQPPDSEGRTGASAEPGRTLYREHACGACHGAHAEGREGYPRLASQHAAYLVRQIRNIRDGRRNNPVMRDVARNLTDVEIEALGVYLESLGSGADAP